MVKIIVLEDEAKIRGFIKINLARSGYEVIEASTGPEALDQVEAAPDIAIAILDIIVPGIDGISVCTQLRRRFPQMGIIMLTAKGQEIDKLEGLEAGADDYVVKPFSPKELVARVNALLRRIHTGHYNDIGNILTNGPILLNLNERKIFKNQTEIKLSPTEFNIIKLLMQNFNKALSREDILDTVWGSDQFIDPKIVDVNIRRIRQKIEDDSARPCYIHTVWGYGYRWGNEVPDCAD